MGSLSSTLDEKSAAILGQELWRKHKETVSKFWDIIAQFFSSLEVSGFRVYQDGLVIGGEEGLKIVDECLKQGSRNYRVIYDLINRGAILVKTEDISLLKREYDYITKLAQAKSSFQRGTAILKYRLSQHKLLEERDNFIAKTIDETLQEGETGILFIGAYHNIPSRLSVNIEVIQVKQMAKVKEYHVLLLNPKSAQKFQELGEYLILPVTNQ